MSTSAKASEAGESGACKGIAVILAADVERSLDMRSNFRGDGDEISQKGTGLLVEVTILVSDLKRHKTDDSSMYRLSDKIADGLHELRRRSRTLARGDT